MQTYQIFIEAQNYNLQGLLELLIDKDKRKSWQARFRLLPSSFSIVFQANFETYEKIESFLKSSLDVSFIIDQANKIDYLPETY
jgi:hypothetical protein